MLFNKTNRLRRGTDIGCSAVVTVRLNVLYRPIEPFCCRFMMEKEREIKIEIKKAIDETNRLTDIQARSAMRTGS